jgi:hypothetical protein
MVAPATPPPNGYALAFEEAVRGLARQEGQFAAIRSGAGILLSAAAIATSFLGAGALQGDRPAPWTWVAIACFAGLSAGTLVILWPRREQSLSATPRMIVRLYLEAGRSWPVAAIQRELALHMSRVYVRNRVHLERAIWAFRVASALLALEVLAWIVNLATVI